MNVGRFGPVLLLLLVLHVPATAEVFRGNVVSYTTIDPASRTDDTLRLGDVLLVAPNENEPFIAGIAFEIAVPSAIAGMESAFGIRVFGGVSPPPMTGPANLEGTTLYAGPLVRTGRVMIRVPFATGNMAEAGGQETVTAPADRMAHRFVAVQIVPQMKGLPPAAGAAEFPVVIRPVPAETGGIEVGVVLPEGAPEDARVTVSLSGVPIETNSITSVEPGIYRLEIRSDAFVDEIRNVGVEAGAVTRFRAELRIPTAMVRFSVPDIATVFLDGEPTDALAGAHLELTAGEHSILVRVGDYTVSRKIFLEADGAYEIGVSLDLFLHRD